MSITFRPAELSGVGLFIAIAGGSRTGKTFSALTLARGIAGPNGRIACIDTEGRRMSHYKNDFLGADGKPFDVYDMPSPFGGLRFLEAARRAQEAGYDVCVIDSFSLEWSGVGGVLEEHALAMGDAEQRIRMANEASDNPDPEWKIEQKVRRLSDGCWNRVKGPGSAHRAMMDGFIQLTMPVIFCLRAASIAKHLLSKGQEEGWKVDQDKRFLFEWTVGLCLHPDTPGKPRYDMLDAKKQPLWKVQDQHRHLFPEGKLISAEAGAALQAWRNTDLARSTTSVNRDQRKPTPDEIADDLVKTIGACETADAISEIFEQGRTADQIAWLRGKQPDLWQRVERARAARWEQLAGVAA